MCVVAIAWRAHPDYRLMVAGNRDELHERASGPLGRWDDGSGLIGGRDLVSGGTWLALTEAGVFGVVTNRRSERAADPAAPSRGRLLSRMVADGRSWDDSDPTAYNPVNLAVIRNGEASIASNWPTVRARRHEAGLIGLSNGDIDEPSPRAEALKGVLTRWMQAPEQPDQLFEALTDETPTQADPSESVFGLAPIFMRHPIYGTRCSTVITVGADGRGMARERRYDATGAVTGQSAVEFRWPA